MRRISGICRNYERHKATGWWLGEGGLLALTHGSGVPWCKCCMAKAQLKHAKDRSDAIPDLERKLQEAKCEAVRSPGAPR